MTETLIPLLTLLAPSLGLSLAVGQERGVVEGLTLYYLAPVGLHRLGRFLPLPLPRGLREVHLPLLALLLPYALYWGTAGRMGAPLGKAYLAFLKGPGLAVPLVLLVAWPLGLHLPPMPATLGAFLLFVGGERLMRGLARRWS